MKESYRNGHWIKIPFVISSLLAAVTSFAQFSVGLEAGWNKNYLVTNNANRAFTYYQPLSSFTIGIPLQYKVNDWFAVAADPSFIQKNYRVQRGDFYAGIYQDNTNNYLQLPLMGHFTFGGARLKGFLNAGVYGAWWMNGTVKGTVANILNQAEGMGNGGSIYNYNQSFSYKEPYSFNSVRDNRFEFGWVAGLGLEFQVRDRIKVFGEGRLLYSFTDQQNNYSINQVPRYNTTVGLNAGVLIRLKNGRKPIKNTL